MDQRYRQINGVWVRSEYREQLLALSRDLLTDWFSYQKSPPEFLYHYTNTDGLLGILKSNRLWATNIFYLNDKSEITYALQLINEKLQQCKDSSNSPPLKVFFERAQNSISPNSIFRDFYVACFCENGDLLSQWRAYTKNGAGFSVGFTTKFIGLKEHPIPGFRLVKIIYDTNNQKSFIDKFIDKTSELLKELIEGQSNERIYQIIPTVLMFLEDHLSEFLFTFKSNYFQEEQEWRAMISIEKMNRDHIKTVQFRNGNGIITPYIELDISPDYGTNIHQLPIGNIILGPTLDQELTMNSLSMMLRKDNLNFVELIKSGVSLR
jgi:hypothetical protein